MKIKNHKKREWWFYPCEGSKLNKERCYIFKYKSDLIKFLTANLSESVNGMVMLEEKSFNRSGALRQWSVWYNDKKYQSGADLKAELRQVDFRGKKYISKSHKISKEDKKYFAYSDKVISLMCHIQDEKGNVLPKDAKRLYNLFIKRGFKDFEPTDDDLKYINGHISDGIDFFHWSDRCNWLRTKTIIEYFKRKNLLIS